MAKRGTTKKKKPTQPRGSKKTGPGKRGTGKSGTGKSGPSKSGPNKGGPKRAPSKKPAGKAAGKTAVNLPPREEGERLQKVLAAAGVASRRECELLIQEGRVEVDGEVVTELGRRVDPFKSKITFDGESLPKPKRLYFAVNKPEGVVSTTRDPSGRARVTDLLPPDVGRVFNVGRLDMASEGLILLTNDGELANQLTHPRHGVEKIYNVQVAGLPTGETLAELRKGVYLAEGKAHFVNARVKSRRKNGSVLEVVLDEGRNREIRRVLARVGHKVQRLTRVAVGPVRLGDLPSGAYRPLTPDEVKALRAAAKPGAASAPKKKPRPRRGAGPKKPAASAKPAAGGGRRVIGGTEEPATARAPRKKKPSRPTKRYGRGKS